MFELLEAYSLLAIQHGSSLILGFIRTKLIASALGPFGLGIFSQANTLFLVIQGFSTLGLGGGFIKLISESHSAQDYERLNKTVVTALSLFGVFSVLFIVLCTVFAQPIARWSFNDPQYGSFILIVVIAGALWVQFQTITYVMRGLQLWREYTLASTVGYGLNLAAMIPLVYLGGLGGAVFSLLVAQVFNLLVAIYIFQKSVIIRFPIHYWKYSPDKNVLKEISRFFAPLLSIQALSYFTVLFIRSEIIRQLGADANGIYQTISGISLAYMGLVSTTIWTYGIPKISSLLKNPEEITQVQNNSLRVSLIVLSPLTVMLLASREIWIPMLFSPAFLLAGQFLFWQFMGDILSTIRINLNITLIPRMRLRYFFFDNALYLTGWIAFSVWLIPKTGVQAVPFGYFLANAALFVVDMVYHYVVSNFRFNHANTQLILKMIPLVAAGFYFAQTFSVLWLRYLVCSAILLVMLAWLPSRSEYRKAFDLVKDQLSRIREKPAHPL